MNYARHTSTCGQRRHWLLFVLVALIVVTAACQAGDSPEAIEGESPVRPSHLGPFVETDPDGVIVEAQWVDPTGQAPALPEPLPRGHVGAVLMETSEPNRLMIAVNGGGCPPETLLSVLAGPPALNLQINLSEGVAAPGYQCADVLTSYAFEIQLSEPATLDDVQLSVFQAG